ncbi:MAG TPA: hypothetical protein VHH36_05130 [Candidatus Thermoplasmatota archaeon]|nr:hypothetical protein [Candidatus Thermoplasmatota archaeon]
MAKEKPYEPKHKGFDEEATRRAHATVDRARETQGAQGEDANREYVDEGPAEYERRTGSPMSGEKKARK